MKETRNVTCRYGVSYPVMFEGEKGAVERGFDLMTRCCCWVCYNCECTEPRDEVLPECGKVCKLWTKTPYCHDKLNDIEAKD